MDEITVHAAATIANVVCGFDCLGFALEEPFDTMTVRRTGSDIKIIHRDDFGLPTDAEKNVAGVALQAMIDAVGTGLGFEVEITKRIKPGSGLGSSAASSAGAVVAANHLLGNKFSKVELVTFAMEGEKLASGAKHPDNVAPGIFGGFTLVRSTEPLDIVSLDIPEMYATLIHPQIEIKTSEARAILPKNVPLNDAIQNWSNLGAFVAALSKGNYELMARSMRDVIVEPARSSLIPKFDEVKAASLAAGAIGGGISGSGPSVFTLSITRETALQVEKAMADVYSQTSVEFNTYVSGISLDGVRVQ
ncbi:MAG: homoserine kinase [Acidobacteriota bacterium]